MDLDRVYDLALRYRCEFCLAAPGAWCRTRTGGKATDLHYNRIDPVRLAWLDGWEQGHKTMRPVGEIVSTRALGSVG
jgi:hypothetical protein